MEIPEKHIWKTCKKHGWTQYTYVPSSKKYKCSKCNSEAVQRRRDKTKELLIEYKGGKCEKCGYNKCVSALEFHHLNPNEKDFGISAKGYTRSWETNKKEVDKCILVCPNCHTQTDTFGTKVSKLKNKCIDCGTTISNKSKRCRKCVATYNKNHNTSRPVTKEQLFDLIKTKSFTEIGKMYNVSDNAVRKWCQRYDLPRTKKELKQIAN